MNLAFFLIKSRQYRWCIIILCCVCVLSFITNIFLAITIAHTQPQTIFVPTTTSEEFVFDGSFSPTYFERLAEFLTQRLLSFSPNTNPLHDIDTFVHSSHTKDITCLLTSFAQPYHTHHIQCLSCPEYVSFHSPNHVEVKGTHKFFLHNSWLKEQPFSVIFSFTVVQGKCLLTQITLTHPLAQKKSLPSS